MTPKEAAEFMLAELSRVNWLDQSDIVWKIHQKDPSLTYQNENGNLALDKRVLTLFKKLTNDDSVVWSRSSRQWRYRQAYDKPGRMQD